MKQSIFTILSNTALTDSVYKMVLSGDTSAITNCGQFVNIQLDGMFLRRPISVCDYDGETLTIVYKVVGKGTKQMTAMQAGQQLDGLCGLGNGFDTSKAQGKKAAVIGGGVGVPPMYDTARRLIAEGVEVTAILGFATKDAAFYIDKFEALGAKVTCVLETDANALLSALITEEGGVANG